MPLKKIKLAMSKGDLGEKKKKRRKKGKVTFALLNLQETLLRRLLIYHQVNSFISHEILSTLQHLLRKLLSNGPLEVEGSKILTPIIKKRYLTL